MCKVKLFARKRLSECNLKGSTSWCCASSRMISSLVEIWRSKSVMNSDKSAWRVVDSGQRTWRCIVPDSEKVREVGMRLVVNLGVRKERFIFLRAVSCFYVEVLFLPFALFGLEVSLYKLLLISW